MIIKKMIYTLGFYFSICCNMYAAHDLLVKKSDEQLFDTLNLSFFNMDEVEKRLEKSKKIDAYLKKYPEWANKKIENESPLTLAVCKHEDETLDILLNNNANIRNRVGPLGLPLLHLACLYVNATAVNKILKKDPSLAESIEPSGNTTCLYQLSQSNEELITETLDYSSEKYQEKKEAIQTMLLSNITSESFLFTQNALGETPLHLATKLNRADLLQKLLKTIKKEDKEDLLLIRDKKGYAAFDYAFLSKNVEMIDLLWTERSKFYDFLLSRENRNLRSDDFYLRKDDIYKGAVLDKTNLFI